MDEEPKHVQRVLYCNNCGEDMIWNGIIEVTIGGTASTQILFDPGDDPDTNYGDTEIENYDKSIVYCKNCEKVFCDGEVTAADIIEFYNGYTEYLESYVDFMGSAPVPSIL